MRIWMAVATTSQATSVEYINGRWLEAGAFRDMTVWVVDGRFSLSRPARVDSVVDLAGGFALPPFGDAHTHVVGDGRTFAQDIERLLADGIFYIRNTNSTHRRTAEARALVNLPTSVDARFAFGGLTSPGGHPAFIYNYGVRRGAWPGWTQAQ
ncbi:MAG TPA: hypothetical protein VK928_03395, partial [Longimicrobiales bacterium]|nr:hypothetical protein [Longimicrobiales bacterium]